MVAPNSASVGTLGILGSVARHRTRAFRQTTSLTYDFKRSGDGGLLLNCGYTNALFGLCGASNPRLIRLNGCGLPCSDLLLLVRLNLLLNARLRSNRVRFRPTLPLRCRKGGVTVGPVRGKSHFICCHFDPANTRLYGLLNGGPGRGCCSGLVKLLDRGFVIRASAGGAVSAAT